jgi:hypothetical protein
VPLVYKDRRLASDLRLDLAVDDLRHHGVQGDCRLQQLFRGAGSHLPATLRSQARARHQFRRAAGEAKQRAPFASMFATVSSKPRSRSRLIMNVTLLEQFLMEECTPYVRDLVRGALEAGRAGNGPRRKRFEFSSSTGSRSRSTSMRAWF